MSVWPIALQQKLNRAGFQKNYGDTRVATEMDVGPDKVRSRYTRGVDSYECEVWLDMSEVATFETFYKTTLGNGTLPFEFPDPITQVVTEFRFKPKTSPVIRPLGGLTFVLTMSWEKIL